MIKPSPLNPRTSRGTKDSKGKRIIELNLTYPILG